MYENYSSEARNAIKTSNRVYVETSLSIGVLARITKKEARRLMNESGDVEWEVVHMPKLSSVSLIPRQTGGPDYTEMEPSPSGLFAEDFQMA